MGTSLKHLAIIPDGNRRWAKKKGLLFSFGHRQGAKTTEKILKYALNLEIPSVTFWGCSLNNIIKRSKIEVNFLFAVFIIISFLAVNYLANRFPTIWQIKINNKGISIGLPNKPESDKFYPLGDIESFDIHSDVGGDLYGELILKFKSKFLPYLKINIHAADEKKIEEFLIKFALRQEHHRSLVDSLSKLMGF